MNRLVVTALVLLVVACSTSGQDVYPRGRKPTPTEVVVQKYAELIVQGALLTPEGWQKAGRERQRLLSCGGRRKRRG